VSELAIAPASLDDPVVAQLVAQLDAELDGRYADLDAEEAVDYATLNLLGPDVAPPHGVVLVARLDGEAVGCGAVRRLDDGVGEVKRMYVTPGARGRGLARALLAALESAAADLGYRRLVLETGIRQGEAMALYESAGWTRIENYGAYRAASWSRCYEKPLSGPASSSS
jgi:GNAT superfamily N-acetyltransferase